MGRRRARCSARRPACRAAGSRTRRDRRDLLLPALHAVQDRVGWISRGALNYICRRLIVPPAEAWGVRHVLSPVQHRADAAGRRARVRRHRLPTERRGAICAIVGRRLTSDASPDADLAAVALPRSVRSRAGGLDHSRGRAARRRRRSSVRRPRASSRLPARADRLPSDRGRTLHGLPPVEAQSCCGGSARSIPRRSIPIARTAAIARSRARSRLGPAGRDRRGDRVESARARRRRVSDRTQVGGGGARAGAAALPRVQRRRVGAGHVQGSRAARRGSVRHRRGDDDRRHSPRAARRASSTCAASIRSRTCACRAPSIARARRGLLGEYPAARASRSTSRSAAAPAPTSAAKRRRSSTRSRASAASRARSRRFRRRSGLFGKPTVVNNVETLVNVLDIVLEGGAQWARGRHEGVDRHATVLPVRPRRAPGAVRAAVRRHARRAAGAGRRRRRRTAAAGDPARRRRGHVRRPRRAVAAAHVRGRARGRRDARFRRRDGVRRHAPISATRCCASPSSWQTNRAANACRAASARCGRSSCCERLQRASGSGADSRCPAATDADIALLTELGQAMRDASICGLGQTASSAIETGGRAAARLPAPEVPRERARTRSGSRCRRARRRSRRRRPSRARRRSRSRSTANRLPSPRARRFSTRAARPARTSRRSVISRR